MVQLDVYVRILFSFQKCLVYLLVTCPISWNMFAAFATLYVSYVFYNVGGADTPSTLLLNCVFCSIILLLIMNF